MPINVIQAGTPPTSDPIIIWTIVIAIATVANVIVAALMWFVTNRYVKITSDIYQSSQRPYIGIPYYELKKNMLNGTISFFLKIENMGNVPAKDIQEDTKAFIDGVEYQFQRAPVITSTLFPKVFDNFSGTISNVQYCLAILSGASSFELVSNITYEGNGSKKYHTTEKALFSHLVNGFVVVEGNWD